MLSRLASIQLLKSNAGDPTLDAVSVMRHTRRIWERDRYSAECLPDCLAHSLCFRSSREFSSREQRRRFGNCSVRLLLLTGRASIGFPGTLGFIGTELLIEGAVGVHPSIGMAVVATAALNGIAILHAYFRIFTGRRHVASFSLRARPSERIAVLILAALIVGADSIRNGELPHVTMQRSS